MLTLDESKAANHLNEKHLALTFIHSPFCGTCHIARKMLVTIEEVYQSGLFYELNASLHPKLMQDFKIESVPCMLITKEGGVVEKIYAFHSVPHMLERIAQYVKM